jgi:gluconokinase
VRDGFQTLERCGRKFKLDLMTTVALRSPSEKVGGLFYFGRMLDKIRRHAKGELPPDYHANLGKGFDEKCVRFLRVNYDQLVERVGKGGTDEEILQWCFYVGRRPSEDDIYVWNEFMRKRGWNDEVSEILNRRKAEGGMADRSDIETAFQFIDADEGRLTQPKAPNPNPQIPEKSQHPNLKPAR